MKTKLLNICVFAILLKVGLAQAPTTGFEIKTMKVSGNVTLLNYRLVRMVCYLPKQYSVFCVRT